MAASQAELARIRLNEDLQYLYLPDPAESGGDETNLPKIGSAFFRAFKKVFWHSSTPIRPEVLNTRKDDDEKTTTITFNIEASSSEETLKSGKTCHRYLFETTGKFSFPRVKVKSGHQESVRIAWSLDAGIYYCMESKFKVGDLSLDPINSSWIDDYRGWNRDSSNDSIYDESVLNVPKMNQWNVEIAPDIATYTLPHFYSYSPGSAFPLFLVNSGVKITHELKVPTNVEEKLLRAQVTENGNDWVDVEYNDVKSLIEVGPQATPALLCDTFDISPEEGEENRKDEQIIIPIQRVIYFKTENTTPTGETSSLNVNTDIPVVACFIKGINTEAEKYNNHGNCTNMLDEFDPNCKSSITVCTCKYGIIEKFSYTHEEMRSDRMLGFFKSIPKRKGRYSHSFCMKSFDPGKLSGVVLDIEMKANICCKMGGKKKEIDRRSYIPNDKDPITGILERKKMKKEEEKIENKTVYYRTEANFLSHSDLFFTKNEKGNYDITCR